MKKHLYLVGSEYDFYNQEQFINFIVSQNTTIETMKNQYSGMEFVFENDVLTEVIYYEDHAISTRDRKLDQKFFGTPCPEIQVNKIYRFIENPFGKHQLCGELPNDFEFPENDAVVPFQYLGFINNEDSNFAWLPFKVHLTFPIYLNVGEVFMDYSNPQKPEIININDVNIETSSYEQDLNRESVLVFEAVKGSFTEDISFYDESGNGIGWSGIPSFFQTPLIPKCPKSGKPMRFLCQLIGGAKIARTNVKAKEEYYQKYYDDLNFWEDGHLYVFIEPDSKVLCYYIRN
jgi:hypothetical protein